MFENGSLCDAETIADTVVVNYFLGLGRFSLLADLLGGSVRVPRSVYDPEDAAAAREDGLSELERGLRLHRRRVCQQGLDPRLRRRSAAALHHFERLPSLVAAGRLVPVDMELDELVVYAQLRDAACTRRYRLLTGLGRGEAAALAIAEGRGLRLATDDQDCIRVGGARNAGFRPLRIRGLLQAAAERGLVALPEARSIHRSMVEAGFRDRGRL
jgi:hypothetical protein